MELFQSAFKLGYNIKKDFLLWSHLQTFGRTRMGVMHLSLFSLISEWLLIVLITVSSGPVAGDRSRKHCALMVHLFPQQSNPDRVDEGERLHLSLSYMGVPQDSVLPLLPFNIYMKLLGEDVCHFGMQYLQCTDDTSSTSQPQVAQMKLFNVLSGGC